MTAKHPRIGFTQGLLSLSVDGKDQASSLKSWEMEFGMANSIGLSLMEWVLNQDRIFENPLMTEAGRTKIKQLSKENKIAIPSLYGACFTQAPFWKTKGQDQIELVSIFAKVLHACADLGIKYIVLPLIEDAALAGPEEQNELEEILLNFVPTLQKLKLMIVFKSLYPPEQRAKVISHYPADRFSLNFDMGNSASLGWNPEQEITLLGGRIGNVHVDDWTRGGEMVPLGEGAVNFPKVFSTLKNVGYNGNYILQTARAAEGQQLEALRRYTRFVAELLEG